VAPGAIEALSQLRESGVRVTIVSGRPVEFLAAMMAPVHVDLIGVYGLERVIDGLGTEVAQADELRALMSSIEQELASHLPSGMTVENKGMSITLHYRQHPQLADQAATLAADVRRRWPIDVRSAKQSVELHPRVETDKGSAVLEFVGSESSVVYIGDDEGDLPGFAALDVLERRGTSVLRVAVGSSELPALLESSADIVLDGPSGVVEFLSG